MWSYFSNYFSIPLENRTKIDGLCERCQNFDIQAFRNDGFPYRGYPLTAVVRSAHDGCGFCSMLVDHLTANDDWNKFTFLADACRHDKGEKLNATRSGQLKLVWIRMKTWMAPVWVHFIAEGSQSDDCGQCKETGGMSLLGMQAFVAPFLVNPNNDVGKSWTRSVYLRFAADRGTPAADSHDIVGQLSVDIYKWSIPSINSIKAWQASCANHHAHCRRTLSQSKSVDVENAPLPTRVIETELFDEGRHARWVLKETAGETGKYITLSHHWRPETEHAQTLKENYDCRVGRCNHDHSVDTVWMKNTAMFYSASLIAAHLGVKYIWIDSICIVQDDGADWNRESAKMADYYQHAWLTIAATKTAADGSLYSITKLEDLPRITRLPYRDKKGEQKGYFYAQCSGETETARDYKANVSHSKLLKRSWVYQEWLLSRRLVTFSDSGVYLQCQTTKPRSTMGDTVQDRKNEWTESVGYVDIAFNKGIQLQGLTRAAIRAKWMTVVETYSGLELTKLDQDRLIALSGVAREFSAAIGAAEEREKKGKEVSTTATPRYVSGHWYGHLRGLLWEQSEGGSWRRVKGLPSWSWASMGRCATDEDKNGTLGGMSVQWATKAKRWNALPEGITKYLEKKNKKMEEKAAKKGVEPNYGFEYRCAFEQALAVPLVGDYEPQFGGAMAIGADAEFEDANRFVALKISGHLLPVRIDGPFASAEDRGIAAALTDHSPDFGRGAWRRVAMVADPETVAGWASVEHPGLQTDEGCRAASEQGEEEGGGEGGRWRLWALVFTRIEKVEGGFGFGNLMGYHAAFQVLFLRARRIPEFGFGKCYERVGVGRLFGNEVDALLRDAERREVWLV
ncbi:hypothetical protein AAE478_008399 [Parahypoxylon ruwenzoriense]